MKANIKNITKKIASWASALAIAMTAAMSSGLTAWADEAYPSVGNGFTAYTISTSRTYTYSSAYLNGDAIGWVDGSDEFKITSLMRNRNTGRVAAKITYSTSRGSKTAWIDYSAITVANPLPTEKNTSRAGLTTYKRPNGARCGSVDYGDTVFKLGNRDGYTNIMYNLGSASNPSGWKYAWVPSSDYDNYIGTKTQSYDYSSSTDLRQSMVDKALGEVGVAEVGNNNVKYNTWYYGREINATGYAWCDAFISWLGNQCGVSTNVIPKEALVANTREFYERQHRFYYSKAYGGNYTPKAGDLVFYGSGGNDHIGIIVASPVNSYLQVVEGNVVVNGRYQVGKYTNNYRRTVNSSYVYGYASPNY